MNLPPALTWMQLFARATKVACETGPAWFGQMLQRHTSDAPGKARVLAVWDKSFHSLSDLPNWDGIIAVKCSGVTTKRLEAAGFPYARRFAVIPNFEAPRWFISLDSPAVAAASFTIYTPARKSAHLKRAAAKLAARLRLPIWYRDTIVIASRHAPPLETKLAELFPGEGLRLALSAGAPEPAINRKASIVVLSEGDGRVLGFVKISGSEVSHRIMEHEAEMLGALKDRSRLKVAVPGLLFAGEVDGRYLTVQTPLAGHPAPAKMTPAHLRFLGNLRCGEEKLASTTAMVATLPQRIEALPAPMQPQLLATLDQLLPVLERTTVRSTIIHGDFAPWNLRLHKGEISAFDWEYGELDGLPLFDETHYTLQLGYLLGEWDKERAHRCLLDLAAAKPLGFEPEQVRAMHGIYLLDNIVRLLGEGYPADHEMVAWYRFLLDKIVAPAPEAALV